MKKQNNTASKFQSIKSTNLDNETKLESTKMYILKMISSLKNKSISCKIFYEEISRRAAKCKSRIKELKNLIDTCKEIDSFLSVTY